MRNLTIIGCAGVVLSLAACGIPGKDSGDIAVLTNAPSMEKEGGGTVQLSAFAPMLSLQESWTCPVCKWRIVKRSEEEEMRDLNGFYEQIKAHSGSCMKKAEVKLQEMIRNFNRRQNDLNGRLNQWQGRANNWKSRVNTYETAVSRFNQDVAAYNRSHANLQGRIDDFNRRYGGRPLDPDTYRYAESLKSSLQGEINQMNSRKADLDMIGTGLNNSKSSLEREQGDLERQRQQHQKEQEGLDRERAELEKMMGK